MAEPEDKPTSKADTAAFYLDLWEQNLIVLATHGKAPVANSQPRKASRSGDD